MQLPTSDGGVRINQIYRTTIKRIFDAFFGVLLLICLSPLMLVLAIWIKLDSKGPVLFKQERVGRNGKRFTIYKFRSMSDDAPHQMATSEFDTALSYITRSGRLMRKTSLDELPQLVNVVKGEMSFIGPRPLIPKWGMKLLESKVVLLNRDKIKSRFIYHGVKRVFDFLAAACGIIILSPLMLIIAVLIKSEDHGPVFYKQKRIGQNGKAFEMYKFRSMFVNADQMLAKLKEQNDVDGPMFKMKDDPRVTKIGHFIRKHSLDELPQFLNVLRGDMSLVGPRPPLPSEVEEYSEYDKQRLFVIPGCTGLWQATERNEVGFNEMVQLDIEYIQRAGFLFDLWIMVKTVGIVIKPNGSY